MSSERVSWRADDPEGSATQINGRPIHALWSMLRPSFHRVFLEPHRPAGATTVGWRWSGDAVPKAPALAHLTDLRQLMRHALLDLTADLERREGDADSVNPQELLAVMSTLVNGLVDGTDEDLGTYAVEVEDGWFIRSWGFSRPASARQTDGTEQADEQSSDSSAPAADAVSGDAAPSTPSAPPPSSEQPKSPARLSKRLRWVVAIVALIGLGLVLFWAKHTKRLSFGGASTTPAETPPAAVAKGVLAQGVEHHATPTVAHTGDSPDAAHGAGQHASAGGGSLGGSSALSSTHGGASAAPMVSFSMAAGRSEASSAKAAVPSAIQGVMPTLPERPDAHAGPVAEVAPAPESAPHFSTHDGAATEAPPTPIPSAGSSETVSPEHAESSPSSSTPAPVPTSSEHAVNSTLDPGQPVPSPDAPSSPPKPPASPVTAEATPPAPEASPPPLPVTPTVPPVDAQPDAPPPPPPPEAEAPTPANPEPTPSVTPPDAPTPADPPAQETRPPWLREHLQAAAAAAAASAQAPADATADAAHSPDSPPAPTHIGNLLVDLHAPVPTPTTGGAGAPEFTAKPAPEAPLPPPVVVIPPTQVSCKVGEFKVRLLRDAPLPTLPIERAGNDSLLDARAKAWAGTQALKPESFRTPLIQGGWSFRLAPGTVWATPPKWLDVATGQPLVDAKVSADRLRLSWTGLIPTQGLSAHLVSEDGHEWARVVVTVADRRIEVTTGPEFIESAPWFAVELTAREAVPGAMVWRSRTPTFSDTRWETQLNRRIMSVRCLRQPATAQEATYGVVALVQPASGWALTWELTLKPEDPVAAH